MDKNELENLLNEGLSIGDIAKKYNKSFTATKYWVNKHGLKSKYNNFKGTAKGTEIRKSKGSSYSDLSHLDYSKWNEEQKRSYSYILGFYLGDGCLGQTKKTSRSKTLFLANQASFVNMNKYITDSLQLLFPNKKIKHYYRKGQDCVNIKVNAISLEELFPHGQGTKHTRKIELKEWQEEICKQYPKEFIKGLMESDGCRFKPVKKYKYFIYQFTNASKDIHNILQKFCDLIQLSYTFRKKEFKTQKRATIYLTCFSKKETVLILDNFIGIKS